MLLAGKKFVSELCFALFVITGKLLARFCSKKHAQRLARLIHFLLDINLHFGEGKGGKAHKGKNISLDGVGHTRCISRMGDVAIVFGGNGLPVPEEVCNKIRAISEVLQLLGDINSSVQLKVLEGLSAMFIGKRNE